MSTGAGRALLAGPVPPGDERMGKGPPERERSELTGLVARAGADLADLALPVDCAGCGRPGASLCRACRACFGRPWRCEEDTILLATADGVPGRALPTWSSSQYTGAARHFLLAWKSGARPDLSGPAHDLGMRAGTQLAAELTLGESPGNSSHGSNGSQIDLLVVPAPSGWRRRMVRRLVAADLARAVAQGIAQAGNQRVWVADILRRSGISTHRLGAVARARSGRRNVRSRSGLPAGLPVLIVDDVVTTGATIDACRTQLQHCGGRIAGAFALAATPPPGRAPRGGSDGRTER